MDDFFDMIIEQKVSQIVMLTDFTEGDNNKCYPYFNDNDLVKTQKYEKITTKSGYCLIKGLSRREITIEYREGEEKKTHKLTHYLYKEWADHSSLNKETLYTIVRFLWKPLTTLLNGEKALVHCR